MSENQFWNVFTRKQYEDNGEQKESWYRAGFIKITATGKKFLNLFQQPNTDFHIFEPNEEEEIREA